MMMKSVKSLGAKQKLEDPETEDAPAAGRSGEAAAAGKEESWGRTGAVLIACLMTLPFFVFLFGGRSAASVIWQSAAKFTIVSQSGSKDESLRTAGATNVDKLLGGLLVPDMDSGACLSRYQSAQYFKSSPYEPSSYLRHKLRQYEARHAKCGPGTPLYSKSIEQLKSGRSMELMDCNYLVWLPYNGLGNRMLSLVSSFLYALLTDRVLLVRATDDFADLFCEPFPGATWALPRDFPVDMSQLGRDSEQTYGNLLGRKKISNDPATATVETLPPFVYLHLEHDLYYSDSLFYCNDDQLVLGKVNWLLLQSDLYFVPSLFAIPEFEDELRWLFPAKESVFHLLARYLLHPTNSVWGMVTRFYGSYLAQAKERIGIQVRIFSWASIPADDMFRQILACSRQENILPDIEGNGTDTGGGAASGTGGTKAILVASLHADYYERFKSLYYEHAPRTGERVGVFQPSHEEQQRTEQRSHNQKALAEIYLLGFCDALLTTGISTFGYVSSGLAGLRPVMLASAKDHKLPATPCVRAASLEPCFHKPPKVDCRGKAVSKEALARHVRSCEDVPDGIKLFD